MPKLVSVCVPTYNGESYLSECLDSIMAQTYPDLEILVVDDGSSDSTQKVVKHYQKQDKRIKLVINDAKLGMVANWNRCVELCKGGWVKLHFQDDLMKPDTIERMLDFALEKEVRLVLTDREYLFEEGTLDFTKALRRLSWDYKSDTVIDPSYFREALLETEVNINFIGEPILGLFHKSLIQQIGNYDERLRQIVDLEFWLRACLHEPIGFIPDRLHQFRVHKSSQGAENTKKRLISVTSMDRVIIADKFLYDPVYLPVRDGEGGGLIQQTMHKILSQEYVSNGIAHMKQAMEEYALNQVKIPFANYTIGYFNDLRNILFPKFK